MRCARHRRCHSYGRKEETLLGLVGVYIQQYRGGVEGELALFWDMTLDEAVEHAALARDGEGKRFSHQRRLTASNLSISFSRLRVRLPEIRQCSDFDELIGIVEGVARDIKGLGELYCYDTALRIGAHIGVRPKYVYLHRGTRVGARNLGLHARARCVVISDLPPELRRLAPHEIEDFLCIFKRELARFNSKRLSRR